MQILPPTGKWIASSLGEVWAGPDSLYEIELNIRYGTWYLDHLRTTFRDYNAAIGAYNWGPVDIQERLSGGDRLPRVYPAKVATATAQLERETYDYYETHFWRSLDLGID